MAKFQLRGADRNSGMDVQITLDANDEQAARKDASDRGVVVSTVARIDEPAQVNLDPDFKDAVIAIQRTLQRVEGELHHVRVVAKRYPPGVRLNRWDITVGTFNAMLFFTFLSPVIVLVFWILWGLFGAAVLGILGGLFGATR